MVLDQLPEAFTRAVLVPANSTLPLEKERLTVAPATPVPVMVKLVPASMFEMMSSAVMASIVGGVTTLTSKTRLLKLLEKPVAARVWLALMVSLPIANAATSEG